VAVHGPRSARRMRPGWQFIPRPCRVLAPHCDLASIFRSRSTPMNPGQNRIFRSLSLAIVLACAFHVPNSEAAVGSWSTTGPFGGANDFLAVYEAGPSTLFAAGRGGLFRSLSAGTAWQRIEVGLPDAL